MVRDGSTSARGSGERRTGAKGATGGEREMLGGSGGTTGGSSTAVLDRDLRDGLRLEAEGVGLGARCCLGARLGVLSGSSRSLSPDSESGSGGLAGWEGGLGAWKMTRTLVSRSASSGVRTTTAP
jgi:hypothetical protein